MIKIEKRRDFQILNACWIRIDSPMLVTVHYELRNEDVCASTGCVERRSFGMSHWAKVGEDRTMALGQGSGFILV